MEISVILPTFNEKENLEGMVKNLLKAFSQSKIKGEIIVVDDNSPDGTGGIADKLAKKYGNIKVIHREKKMGIGSAYFAGARKSEGELIITMDCDNSHNPKDVPGMAMVCLYGNATVLGSRYINGGEIVGWNAYRKLMSAGANMMSRILLRLRTRDLTTGFRAYRRETAIGLFSKVKSSGYSFLLESTFILERKNSRIIEYPIIFEDRKSGKSKLGSKEQINYLKTLARLWFG